jgi:hypothetical protein
MEVTVIICLAYVPKQHQIARRREAGWGHGWKKFASVSTLSSSI